MKKNTQLLLLALYPVHNPMRWPTVNKSHVDFLFPSLTEAGRASLLYFLTQKNLLLSERTGDEESWKLSTQGKDALEAQFPALSQRWQEWREEWSCLVFLQPPKGDPQFRYLRRLVLGEGGIGISRGVYLLPEILASRLERELKQLYSGHVFLFTAQQWLVGSPRDFITEKYSLTDLAAAYSGVSKELSSLLEIGSREGSWRQPHKEQFLMVFHRLWDVLGDDTGLTSVYYGDVALPLSLLEQVQQGLKEWV